MPENNHANEVNELITQSKRHHLVMLIDDDPVMAEALSLMLKEEDDIEMHYCPDPCNALSVAEKVQPTLILLDMVMPDIDGLTLLSFLRVNEATRQTPIVALSMNEEATLKANVFIKGGNDYLVKLPDKIEMLARMRYHSESYIRMLQRDDAFSALSVSQRKLAASNLRLQQLTMLDALTSIANRRQFEEAVTIEWRRAIRDKTSLSIVMADVDHFKNCNDHYGHQHGDEVLRQVARTMENSVKRPADLTARYGGEEFIILLPNTSKEGAIKVAERLRSEVEALHLEHAGSAVSPWVTISLGVATINPGIDDRGHQSLVREADRALYQAKKQGRNRVVLAKENSAAHPDAPKNRDSV